MSDNESTEENWRVGEITTNSHGPSYVIHLGGGDEYDGKQSFTVETVRFNGFTLGLDGRAEVEYREFSVTKEDYPTELTINFYDGQ